MATQPHTNHDEIARLRRAVEELSVLNDLAREIGASRNTGDIIRRIVGRSRVAVKAEEANITLVDRTEGSPTGTVTVSFDREIERDEHFHLNRNLLGLMFHELRAQRFNDLANEPRLANVPIDAEIRNLISVPLLVDGALTGVLSVYNKAEGRDFTEDDQRLLAIIGSQSAQILENARRAAIDLQIQLAEVIQEALLPRSGPGIEGYDIHGMTVPADHLGGDYFDFIPLRDQRWGLALGDVSGKGIPASLLMSNLQATLRSQAHFVGSCHECVSNVNRMLFLSTTPDKFATLFYAVLDTRSNALTYCNAGHEHPILARRSGGIVRLERGGLPVGIMDDRGYDDDVLIMEPGDRVVIFSDGVTDMENGQARNYGQDRLMELVAAHPDLEAADLAELIHRQVRKHADGCPPIDDVTIVVIRREE